MVLRELSESEWQHSFVPVLKLAGSASSKPSEQTTRVLGDVKHIMVRGRPRQGLRTSTDPWNASWAVNGANRYPFFAFERCYCQQTSATAVDYFVCTYAAKGYIFVVRAIPAVSIKRLLNFHPPSEPAVCTQGSTNDSHRRIIPPPQPSLIFNELRLGSSD